VFSSLLPAAPPSPLASQPRTHPTSATFPPTCLAGLASANQGNDSLTTLEELWQADTDPTNAEPLSGRFGLSRLRSVSWLFCQAGVTHQRFRLEQSVKRQGLVGFVNVTDGPWNLCYQQERQY